MPRNNFCYTFRFCCDPEFNGAAESESLLRYTKEAAVDDVAVFANVEEMNTGHMDAREQEVYLALMRSLKPKLAAQGVTLSVNQWHSLMHADLGKKLRPEQHFRRMVDPYGREAELCVCPLDGEWRRYIAGLYARYAQLHPNIVWVEDDFRYHNHDPLEWGGCFCEEHMKLYSKKAGKPLTREEFVSGVLQPGPVHPYRKIWLDTCDEVLCEVAGIISRAVHEIAPETKVGLMSSAPHIHAAEGRDWNRLLHAFAGPNEPVDRIHLPGYSEGAAWKYLLGFNMVSMACRALLPKETLVYPELENYPYSLFAKSRRFTRFQMLAAMPLDQAGITIDLYDLNGNGIVWEEGYQDILRTLKPCLNRLTGLGAFSAPQRGVCVMLNGRASYSLHTETGKRMEELYPRETFFAGLLPAMGIPFRYCTNPSVSGETVAVSGQYLRSLNTEEIQRLFRGNFVILNGDALAVLVELGLGRVAGVRNVVWHRQNDGSYAFEQVTNGKRYCGIESARASAMISCSDALEVTYEPDAAVKEYSAFFDSFRRRAFPAETVVNGKVMIFPFGRFSGPLEIPQMLLNNVRQSILQDVLRERLAAPMVEKLPYLEPYCTVSPDGQTFLYLVNGSSDDVGCVRLLTRGSAENAMIISPDGDDRTLPCRSEDGGMEIPLSIPALSAAMLIFPGKTGERSL